MPPLQPANPANDYGAYKGSAANHHFIIENVIDTLKGRTSATTNALEGLKVESPVGEIEMRACDHQAVLPLYMGTLKKVPQYNFLISSDIVTLPGRDILPTCEEVRKIRGGS